MKNRKGFTLSELLVVIAIIAVLVAISIPVFTSQLEKSRQAVDKANARSIYAVLSTAINDGTIEFSSDDQWISVLIWRNNSQFSVSSNSVTVHSVTGGNGPDNAKRLRDVVATSGMIEMGQWINGKNTKSNTDKALFVRSKNDTTGWNWYRVYAFGDGSICAYFGVGESESSTVKPNPNGQDVTYILGQ